MPFFCIEKTLRNILSFLRNMSLITQYTFIIRWLHRKASLLIKKTCPFLKKLFFHKKTITTIRPSLLPTKKSSLERLPFLWKGFYWHNLLIILFLSVIFRTILYPIGASGQGYCCTALGRGECVGIKASGGSDILVTKLRRYRCYAYSILWVSKLPIYRRLGQACERRARLLEESRARKKPSNNPLNPHPLEMVCS